MRHIRSNVIAPDSSCASALLLFDDKCWTFHRRTELGQRSYMYNNMGSKVILMHNNIMLHGTMTYYYIDDYNICTDARRCIYTIGASSFDRTPAVRLLKRIIISCVLYDLSIIRIVLPFVAHVSNGVLCRRYRYIHPYTNDYTLTNRNRCVRI